MDILHPNNATRVLGAPADWNPETQGECTALPVIDTEHGGKPWMVSIWRLNDEEIAKLLDGHALALWVQGTDHPVVAFGITDNAVPDMPVAK